MPASEHRSTLHAAERRHAKRPEGVAMTKIEGTCEPQFSAVADAFRHNFEAGREVGASIGVYHLGRPVVELWGGIADTSDGRLWERRTITPIASTGKSLATACVLLLAERG
jgi:CubicO group peptidase (beta-lactamase class C family)